MTQASYIGRFAPTPSGPLHFGSLVAAVASYLDAKKHQGHWLLRIEDLDPPRESEQAKIDIPRQLNDHGLHWDGGIQYQSLNSNRYEQALDLLAKRDQTFPCQCSRKQLQASQGLHLDGPCKLDNLETASAIRLSCPASLIAFTDLVYGPQSQHLANEVGDFVLKRRDGLYAYQLAVVVDDHQSGVSRVVRGLDLLDNTARQIYLQRCLGYPTPEYLHLPLAINHLGQKLSKQNMATSLDQSAPRDNLFKALGFLGLRPPEDISTYNCATQLEWALTNWRHTRIKPCFKGT